MPRPPLRASSGSAGSRPAGMDLVYVPGHYVRCCKPAPLPAYHADGWSEPGDTYTGMEGVEASLEFIIRRPRDSYRLSLDVHSAPEKGRGHALEVFFNYFRLGYCEISGPGRIELDLPFELFILRTCRMQLHCTRLGPTIAGDRAQGFGLRGWVIE